MKPSLIPVFLAYRNAESISNFQLDHSRDEKNVVLPLERPPDYLYREKGKASPDEN